MKEEKGPNKMLLDSLVSLPMHFCYLQLEGFFLCCKKTPGTLCYRVIKKQNNNIFLMDLEDGKPKKMKVIASSYGRGGQARE